MEGWGGGRVEVIDFYGASTLVLTFNISFFSLRSVIKFANDSTLLQPEWDLKHYTKIMILSTDVPDRLSLK